MREWVELAQDPGLNWVELAAEARQFLAGR